MSGEQKEMMNTEGRDLLHSDVTELGRLIIGMRNAYALGENAMEYARQTTSAHANSPVFTLIAYDLQAGSYIAGAKANPEARIQWCGQLAKMLNPYITEASSILEVGSGEATTLAGVLKCLDHKPKHALGFDISWSRCAHGVTWLADNDISANLFVADLFEIPLDDSSIDVIYTSHSLEPNGGREKDALKELLRVARRAVVLIEPIYELANAEAQARMRAHGYVRGLREIAENLGASVCDYRLLDYYGNPLNPSGVILIEKPENTTFDNGDIQWRCPLTHSALTAHSAGFSSKETGLVYPVLGGIPLLRSTHAIVASSFADTVSIVHSDLVKS